MSFNNVYYFKSVFQLNVTPLQMLDGFKID